jgi:hypothetical protein
MTLEQEDDTQRGTTNKQMHTDKTNIQIKTIKTHFTQGGHQTHGGCWLSKKQCECVSTPSRDCDVIGAQSTMLISPSSHRTEPAMLLT